MMENKKILGSNLQRLDEEPFSQVLVLVQLYSSPM